MHMIIAIFCIVLLKRGLMAEWKCLKVKGQRRRQRRGDRWEWRLRGERVGLTLLLASDQNVGSTAEET